MSSTNVSTVTFDHNEKSTCGSVGKIGKCLASLILNQSMPGNNSKKNSQKDSHGLPKSTKKYDENTKNTSEDKSSVVDELITPQVDELTRSSSGQHYYMRNYPNGNDHRYLSVENNTIEMTGITTVNKCKFLLTQYTDLQNLLVAVTFQHVDSSKYISSTASSIELIDSIAPVIFQSTDSKLFYRHFDSEIEHYYFESVTNRGHYLVYDRTNDDVDLLQISNSDLQGRTGRALDVFFKHVSL